MKTNLYFLKEFSALILFSASLLALSWFATDYFDCPKSNFFYFTHIFLCSILMLIIGAAKKLFSAQRDEKTFLGFLLVSLMTKLLFSLTAVTAFIFAEPEGKNCLSLLFTANYFAYTGYFIGFVSRFSK
ncbi:MAG: hypothetical protein ACXITV_04630 [Luteibaculaceae bacterium]